ncbi:MAG TPA: superoxide dismutase [Bacteroidota bacterium]|nr:superoxide dismutase [Bacteroidota bacterium]
MKILALEHELSGADPTAVQLKAEAQAVWDLEQSGVIREIYFRADRNAAVIILEAPDVASADAYIQRLPLVASHLIRFELIPLKPYPGFRRLFSQ